MRSKTRMRSVIVEVPVRGELWLTKDGTRWGRLRVCPGRKPGEPQKGNVYLKLSLAEGVEVEQ